MRKSFTRLSSVLVLLFLSIQMVMAAPALVTNGLSPADGGVLDPTNPVFTLTLNAPVEAGEGQIIGLYNDNAAEPEGKAIQLQAVNKTVDGDVVTYTHADGTVVFNANVVTITFNGVNWKTFPTYWITIGPSAIWNVTGNLNVATAFDGGAMLDRWDFTVKDLIPPTWTRLTCPDDAEDVPTGLLFGMHFDEPVTFADEYFDVDGDDEIDTIYSQMLEDIAVYTSVNNQNVIYQEGGDLISVYMPTITLFNGNTEVGETPSYTAHPDSILVPISANIVFDSISIEWESSLPPHTDLYVRVEPGLFEDLSGNLFEGINNETDWNFSTKDDEFVKPEITSETTPLNSDDDFKIDFADAEDLFMASSGAPIKNNQDLKLLVSVKNAAGEDLAISTAKIAISTNTITVDLASNMIEEEGPFTVCFDAEVLKDASGNLNEGNCATFGAGNWNAPEIVEAYVSNQSGTTFDLYLTTNEPAAVHYIVVRKDPAIVPTTNEVFGHSKDLSGAGVVTEAVHEGTSNNDVYYRIDLNTTTTPLNTAFAEGEIDDDIIIEGNDSTFYGKQTASDKRTLVEIFAEGDVYIPQGNYEVLERIVDLPATHGFNDDPTAEYEIYYVLIDTMNTDGAYASNNWLTPGPAEHLSPVLDVKDDVYTIDILMPEAWFDGDTILDDEFTPFINDINKDLPYVGALEDLERDGKIYINFNETIHKANGTDFSTVPATLDDELHDCLWVYEGNLASNMTVNSDTNWVTNYGYTASLSADKMQIIIEPDSSWASEASVWVKIKNSEIEDNTGNEIVPYDALATAGQQALYTQEYIVEDYIAPLVRYTYEDIYSPMDGMTDIPYQKFVDGEYVTTTIDVTVSEHIYVPPGTRVDGDIVTNDDELIPFTSNPDDDQYIGKFFKIRKGDSLANVVDESSNDVIEGDFIFEINYDYGDSTQITITPAVPFESEIWYFIEMDENIQDGSLRTILEGASVDDNNDRPQQFKLNDAWTGNATDIITPWVAGSSVTDDNKTMVFKSDDSRNPLLMFFSKKQSTLLTDLENLDGLTEVAIDDTIGVYIDEYVSLGFDHYVHFDALTGEYTLDANAMRRYFKVFDSEGVEMNFDILDIWTIGLDPAVDSMVFYIDPYYVDEDGLPILDSEDVNFDKDATYTAYFNSVDPDDNGIQDQDPTNVGYGKEKGIYWDDNGNLVMIASAEFTTLSTVSTCVNAIITPVPGSENLDPTSIEYITIEFEHTIEYGTTLPELGILEGAAGMYTTSVGQAVQGSAFKFQFPVSFESDSTYRISFGDTVVNGGQIYLNSLPLMSWPANDCNTANVDSVWTYAMVDATPPELDTMDVSGAFAVYGDYLVPMDDSIDVAKTDDLVMVFTEEVKLVNGKKLTIYDSDENVTVKTVWAQNCHYGYYMDGSDKKEDKHVIVIPASNLTKLKYNTNYHVSVDEGFVVDFSPLANKYEGIYVEDLTADGSPEDMLHDWSFAIGDDPAPFYVKFTPADGQPGLMDLSVEFSEPVYDAPTPDLITIYEVTAGPTYTVVDNFSPNSSKISANGNNTVWTIDISDLDGIEMEYGKQYAVNIPAEAFIDGNGSILTTDCDHSSVAYSTVPQTDETSDPAIWYVDYSDIIDPYVMNTWPRNGYEHIPYNAYIYIEFNEPIVLSDGSAIIPDPNLLEQTIDGFLTVSNESTNILFDVEFVGNDKQMLRITPKDPNGYGYNPSLNQPTMMTYEDYTITLNDSYSGYELWDAESNVYSGPTTFMFKTEDITPPVLYDSTYNVICDKTTVDFTFDAIEATDTLNVYWAIYHIEDDKPDATTLFDIKDDVEIEGAVKQGKVAGNAGANGVSFTVDMGEWLENPEFKLYAVTEDLEEDVWAPATTDWDTLFMFGGNYGEGYDRIRDILPSPNRNPEVFESDTFMIWDNDAPTMTAEFPVRTATQVPVDVVVEFTMSEDIVLKGGLVPDSITLRRYDNNIAVQSLIEWDASDSTITITPLEDLKQETKYYVEIDRYAIEDEGDVCTDNTVFFPQWVGRDYWFQTEDNIGPRFHVASPENDEDCVSCPDLNAAGDAVIELTFYDANPVIVAANAPDPYIYFYRAEEPVLAAWAVVPASSVSIAQGANDTTWVVSVPLSHQYYSNDSINVVAPAGLFSDIYGNIYTNNVGAYLDGINANQIDFDYLTCNTEAPAVTWAIHALNGFFNYSEATSVDNGIYGDWIDAAYSGSKGATVTGVSTHAALKVDFGEAVEFHTGPGENDWEDLASISDNELMAILNISGLQYDESSDQAKKSDLVVLDKSGNTVTIGFRTASSAANLPVYDLLASAENIAGHVDGGVYPFLDDFYEASLESETTYEVTVDEEMIRAAVNCKDLESPRYVLPDIVTFTTRNDLPPTTDITNLDGESLCEADVCIQKDEVIVVSFSDPVVKTSFDVSWLGEESFSYDNLPLNENDLTATDAGKYIEFFQVNRSVASDGTVTYTRTGSAIPVYVVALDDAMMNYQITPQNDMMSEGWYEIALNKYTVKKFENNGPNGTVFEGSVCRFFVNDYINPKLEATADGTIHEYIDKGTIYEKDIQINVQDGMAPYSLNQPSEISNLYIIVDETPALGTGTMKLRREDGTVFAEFDASEGTIAAKVPASTNPSNPDTIIFNIGKELEEFMLYYIEAPVGFITDDNEICAPNPMDGFEAELDPATGELLSADWWFKTTDKTPPQLISINREGEELAPNALFPEIGGTVSKNSVLIMRFDENININPNKYAGIVIYHDNGQDPDENFGNAVEFIPWYTVYAQDQINFHQIDLSGSDIYNGFTNDIVTIDPKLEFEANGTYYVRVSGVDVTDNSGNMWATKDPVTEQLDGSGVLDQIIDTEWWFTVTNDVEPILVETDPDYDGVNAAGVYEEIPSLPIGYVLTDLTLTFADSDGNALDVARGDELRMLRVFEYTYDAEFAQFMSKPWIEIPITHDSIEFVDNKVIVHGVVLRDGIHSTLPSTGLATDSCYYVTVDPGAVLNGYDLSQTWWPGISHGFRWRFTTGTDDVAPVLVDIVSPNVADDAELGKDLEVDPTAANSASILIVDFNEGVEALDAPTGMVKIYDADADSLVESIVVTPEMCEGVTLTVPATMLYDETNFYVVVEAGAFGDTSTVSVPNVEFGGIGVWEFHTGDNTPPVPVTAVPDADCAVASPIIVLTYDETINDDRTGVEKNAGTIVITDEAGDEIATLTEADIEVDGNTVTIDLMAAGVALPDTTEITVTLSEGLVLDGDTHSPLPSPEFVWTFTTGENTLPFATLSPAFVITPDTVLTLTFNEAVNTVSLKGDVVINGDTITLVSTDSINYTAQLTELMSETTYDVVIAEGTFMDVNEGCTPNGNAEVTLTFEVDDIAAPVAEYYPSLAGDYRDLELVMVFDEAVDATEGYVVIYTEAGEFADSIEVGEFATTDNITYTYTTNELFFGSYYVLIDAGTFVDESAAPVGVEYAGIDTEDVWTIDILDPSFENCLAIISPEDGEINVPVDTELVMTFECEVIKPGAADIRYITVAKQDNAGQEFFIFEIVDSLISEDGHTLTVPVSGLDEMTTYSVTIAPGAIEDEAGNQFSGIIDANTWNFTTGDATAPVVTLVADTVTNLDGSAVITSDEAGTVYFVHTDVPANVAAITTAIAEGKAVSAAVVAVDEAITVSTVGLAEGLYYAVATDAAGNVGQSVDQVLVVNIPTVTIAEIQGTGDDSPLVGQVVTTSGSVSGIDENGFFIQDANAARSGIYVYNPEVAATITLGTSVKVSGTVDEYYGLTELTDVIAVDYVASIISVEPVEVTEAASVSEDYESVLISYDYLHTTDLPDDNGEWMTIDANGAEVKIDEQMYAFTPEMDQAYEITGIVNYTWDEFKLAPRVAGDITSKVPVIEFALGNSIEVYPNPFNDFISLDVPSELVLTKAVITNIAGQIVKEVINPNKSIETTQLHDGVYFISLHTVDGIAKTSRIVKR